MSLYSGGELLLLLLLEPEPEPVLSSAMFVQEEKIFAGNVLKIHICTMEGTEWLEEVTEDTTIEKLKEKCLKHVRSV